MCVVDEVRKMHAKVRRTGFDSLEHQVIDFYDSLLPPECYDLARFEKWRRREEQHNPEILYLKVSDLINEEVEDLDRTLFPDALVFENLQLPLSYQLQPGEEQDGVTVTVNEDQLRQLSPALLDWLVPGLVEEKIAALIKTLPKHLRTKLIPAPDTAKDVWSRIQYGHGPFLPTIASQLKRISGDAITAESFRTG